MDGWIVIPNWRRFQHYKNRNPPWIKVYTELMSDPAFLGLSFAERGLLITLWLEYARGRGMVSLRSGDGHSNVRGRHVYGHLKALSDAGFIEVSASKPLAPRKQNARPELLRNSKSGDDRASAIASSRKQLMAAAQRFADTWNGGSSEAFDEALDELEQLTGARLHAGDRYRLWDRALHHSHG